jgi:hypothetical protein
VKRIVNTADGRVPTLTRDEALKLLRTRHVDEDGIQPLREAKEALYAAFPAAVRTDESGARRVNLRRLLDEVLLEFVPAFQPGKAQGRPAARTDGLVACVERLVRSGEAKTITHACAIIDRRGLAPGIADARAAYYRRRKSLR